MIRRVLLRLLAALGVLLGVSLLVFFLVHLVPGDPVDALLGESATAADRAALRTALGLDRPLAEQLVDYFAGLASGDLGQSLRTQRPVLEVMLERLPATALLAAAGLLVAVLVALPLALLAASRPGRFFDRLSITLATLGVAVPNFVLGPLLILVFALWLGVTPVSGREGALSLLLPALTLGLSLAGILARMLRASLLEVAAEDYLRTARAKGLGEAAVVRRHALPNALLPALTVLGLQLGALLSGTVITEVVFAWPGLGQLTVEAIQQRDYPLLQGCVLLISVLYVLVNNLTDLAYSLVDPRIRLAA